MWLVANKPVVYEWPYGEIHFKQNEPKEVLDELRALRILKKAYPTIQIFDQD